MKQCPKCNRPYADTLNYCLQDGTALVASYDRDATFVATSGNIDPPGTAAPSRTSPAIEIKSGNRINLSYLVILILAVLLAGSAVALLYEREKPASNSNGNQIEQSPHLAPGLNSNGPVQIPSDPTSSPATQAKTQARFSVTACNSIKDLRSGLEWYVGPDRNMSWDDARQWTISLGACEGGWRMPTVDEIRTLYDPTTKAGTGYYTGGKYFPAHIDPVFNAIGGGSWVWANGRSGADAQSFNLNQGKPVTYSAMNTLYSTRAFAVHSIQN